MAYLGSLSLRFGDWGFEKDTRPVPCETGPKSAIGRAGDSVLQLDI